MKSILYLTIFLGLTMVVLGAQYIYPANEKYPGKCYAEEFGVMNPEQIIYTKDCARVTCSHGGEIVVHTCGVVLSRCGTTSDLSKNYPDCCPRGKKCKNDY